MVDVDSSLRRLFKGGGVVLAGLLLDNAISFLAKVAISRYLGPAGYGGVSIGLVIVFTIQRVGLLGTDKGVARYLPRFETDEDRKGVVLTGVVAGGLTVLALSAVAFVGAPVLAMDVFDDPELVPVIRIFAVVAPFAAALRFTVGTVRGLSRTLPRVALQNVVEPASRALFIASAVALGAGVVGGASAYALPYVAAGVPALWYLRRRTPLSLPVRGRTAFGELLAFSAPLAVTGSMWFVFSDIDTYLVGYYLTTGDVGVYQVVYPLAVLLTLALSAFGFLTMPVLSEHHAEGRDDALRGLYRTLAKWVFAVSLPPLLVYLVLPRAVIGVTFGQEYVEGALALAVLAVGFGSHAVVGPNTNALTSLGHSRLVMYDSVGAALSNVALNVVLVPRYGIAGAAAATTVSYVLVNGLMTVQLYRIAGIQPFSRGLVALGVAGTLAFPPVLAAVDAVLAVTSLPGLLALALVYGVIYLLLAALVGVGEDELRIVGDVEHRFGVDLWVVRRLARLGPGAPD